MYLLSYNSEKYNSIKLYVHPFSWKKVSLYCFRLSHFSMRRKIYIQYTEVLYLQIGWVFTYQLSPWHFLNYFYVEDLYTKWKRIRSLQFRFSYNSKWIFHHKHSPCAINSFNSDETYIFTLVNYLLISFILNDEILPFLLVKFFISSPSWHKQL